MVGETGIVNLFHLSCCLVIRALELGCLVVSLLTNQREGNIRGGDTWGGGAVIVSTTAAQALVPCCTGFCKTLATLY